MHARSQGLATTASPQQQHAPQHLPKERGAFESHQMEGRSQACFAFIAPCHAYSILFEMTRARGSSLVGRFGSELSGHRQRKNRSTTGLPSLRNRLTEDIRGIAAPEAKTAKHICCLKGRMTDHLILSCLTKHKLIDFMASIQNYLKNQIRRW